MASASKAAEGSSSKRSFWPAASAAAIAILCCCPAESWSILDLSRPSISNCLLIVCTRRSISATGKPSCSIPNEISSITLSVTKAASGRWFTKPIRFASSCGRFPDTPTPSRKISPEV